MPGRWSHSYKAPGEYVLSRDGDEVAMVTILPELGRINERLDHLVAALEVFDTEPAEPRRGDDFKALGWRGRAEHDRRRNLARARALGYPLDVKAWLTRQRESINGGAWPLSPADMERWEELVRTARERFEQDRAAERSAIDLATEDDADWITTPPPAEQEAAA